MTSVTVLTDEDKLAERLAVRLAPLLLKMLPQILAAKEHAEDRVLSGRESRQIACCRPETIAAACKSGKLKSRNSKRKTPTGAPHRIINYRDLRDWIDRGRPV